MQINKRIEEILDKLADSASVDFYSPDEILYSQEDALKDLLSLLHDFSRKVVGEEEVDGTNTTYSYTGKDPYLEPRVRNKLKSEQLERADKLLKEEA